MTKNPPSLLLSLFTLSFACGSGRDVIPESHDVRGAAEDAGARRDPGDYEYVAKRTLAVVGLGIASAMTLGAATREAIPGDPNYYVTRQVVYLVIGLILMVVLAQIDYARLRRLKYGIYALLILSIYGVTSVSGAFVGAGFFSIFYLMIPNWITNQNIVSAIQPLGIGLAVFALAQHPEGAIAQNRDSFARWRSRRGARAVTVLADAGLAALPEASEVIGVSERKGGA